MLVRLSCGVEFERDPAILDDMQLIDLIAEVDEDVTNVSRLVRAVFGEARSDIYAALRDEEGRVPTAGVVNALGETITQLAGEDEKKYLPSSTSYTTTETI